MYFADYGMMPSATDGKINNIDWGGEFIDGSYVGEGFVGLEKAKKIDPEEFDFK